MRRNLPYSADLGSRLRSAARPSDRALWLRQGTADSELFLALPLSSIILLSHSFTNESASTLLPAAGAGRLDIKESWPSFWAAVKEQLRRQPASPDTEELPFRGGLAGHLGYGGAPTDDGPGFPTAFLGHYPDFVLIDHAHQSATLVCRDDSASSWERLLACASAASPPNEGFCLLAPFEPLTSPERYRTDFRRIQAYLHSGDCYQVNYAQAFRAHCRGNGAQAMERLLAETQPAWAAWMRLPEGEVMSLSPELFLKIEDGLVTTRPIKGTAPRATDPDADRALAAGLAASAKNQAENLMIVDLLRHDLGQHALTGSVCVESLFDVESLPQVHHLVSTVRCRLAPGADAVDMVRDAFPGGSITGAPKRRAMEIIAELEPVPRSVYCGSIGFFGADGSAQFNIAIRTLLRTGDTLHAWAGGGIVADSECEAEYQECFHKIGALMRALEAMGR